MNKFSCASALLTLAQENLAVSSPVAHRQRLRICLPAGVESSDEGTTPEAHTDGDNDSAFDSDDDEKHGLPAPRCLHPRTPNPLSESYRWPCIRKSSVPQRALPRKQLGSLPPRASRTQLAPVPNPWSDVQKSLPRPPLVPIAPVGEANSSTPTSFQLDCEATILKPERREAVAGRKMRARVQCAAGQLASPPPPTTQGGVNPRPASGSTGTRRSAGDENTIPYFLDETPRRPPNKTMTNPLPSKKRRMGAASGLPPSRRGPELGGNPGGMKTKSGPEQSAWSRDKRATHADPVARVAAHGLAPGGECGCSHSDTGIDLSCKEVIDMDEVMCRDAEVRTPICRFLIPSWPEGVEGYEEVGGWRRLGGSATPELFTKSEKHG